MTDWFHHKFVPTLQEKLREIGCEPKAVLLQENCSADPDEEELVSANGKVIGKFLLPNVTSLILPLDQGVFVSIKWRYWRNILEELVLQDNSGISIVDCLKGIHLLKVSETIALSWNEIKLRTLPLSWRKILPLEDEFDDEAHQESRACAPPVQEFQSYFQVLWQDLDENEINEWLQTDTGDKGYKHLTDADIITQTTCEPTRTYPMITHML